MGKKKSKKEKGDEGLNSPPKSHPMDKPVGSKKKKKQEPADEFDKYHGYARKIAGFIPKEHRGKYHQALNHVKTAYGAWKKYSGHFKKLLN